MIETGATEEWTVTTIFTVDLEVVTAMSGDCDLETGESGTGLLNCASVSDGVPTMTSDVCEPIPMPGVSVAKAVTSSATPTGNPNEFSIEYTITVMNTGDAKAFYDLTDTLKYGLGASVVSATALYVGGGAETNSGVDNTGNYDGIANNSLSTNEMIETGATESWTVTVVFIVDTEVVTEMSGDCNLETSESGTGLLNYAAVSGGVPTMITDVCEPIPMPSVEISKAITNSATPTGNPNEFSLEYTITVTSTGDAKAFYDLSDTLKYGEGATVVNATALYEGGGTETNSGGDNTGSYDGIVNNNLSTNEMIEEGATESWTVTVVFIVDTEVVTEMSGDCTLETSESGTGLLNCAAVSGGVPTMVTDVCEPIPMPAVEISKAITNSATPTGNPNEFSLEYTITVTSTGDAKAFYDLSDTLKYGEGANVVSATALYIGGGTETNSGVDNTGSYDGLANNNLSTNEMIEEGATESWTVTVVFTVDTEVVTAMSGDCILETSESGTGLLNCAAVSGGVPTMVTDVCEPIPMPAVSVEKAITSSATPTGNPNEFSIEYTITVTNIGDAKAFYDLTDTLKYGEGANVVSATALYIGGGAETNSGVDNTANFDGTADFVISDDEMIETGATEEWTVTTIFTIDTEVVTTMSGDCNLETNETGTGLLNFAVVSGGVPMSNSEICEVIPTPSVSVEKIISSSASPTGNQNEFTIEYTITVTSTGDAKAFYDLTDNIKYGLGTDLISVTAAYIGGGLETNSGIDNTMNFDGISDFLLSDNEMIEVGGQEAWTVTTVFTVDPNVVSEESADCNLDISETGTGLLNCATVSDGVPTETVEVCETTPTPAIEIVKSIAESSTWTGNPFEYSISYNITISNIGDAKAFYDLTDTLKYGLGANIESVSATYIGGGAETNSGLNNTGNFDGTSDYLISDNEMIEAGGSEAWDITVVYTIDITQLTPESEDCNLDTDESGTGLLNCASVSDGVPDDTDDACEPLPPVPAVDIVKDIADIQPAASGILGNADLTIDFKVTNIGNTDIINLSVIDDLVSEFGSAFVSIVGIPSVGIGTATSAPTVNTAFTGSTPALNMLLGNDGFLMREEFFTIQIMVEVDPNAIGAPDPLENQATVLGMPIDENEDPVIDPVTGDTEVTDVSDSGTMSEDTNPGEPGDEGTTDDPTEIRIPLIAAVKSLKEYLPATSGEVGHFDIVMEIGVKNIGNVPLHNITLEDDMTTALPDGFGALFESIVYDGTYPNIDTLTTAVMPGGLNPLFDGGVLDAEIFDGSGILEVNEEIFVQIRIELDASNDLGVAIPDTIYNLAMATGDYTDPNSNETTTVEDDSDSGVDFETTNPDEPGDMETPDDPTPVPLLGKIGDYVWNDCNGNGIQDSGEVGIPNVQINLFDSNGNFFSAAVTDADGLYAIEFIPPGDYYIFLVPPDGFELTFSKEGFDPTMDSDIVNFDGLGGTSAITNVAPVSCDTTSFDVGLYQCVPIGDLVWFDNDKDDVFDSTENGINGLRVNLYRQVNGGTDFEFYDFEFTGHKPGTPSDDGYYKFCAPPGTYYLEIGNTLNGLVPVQEYVGNDPEIDSDITNEFGPNTTDAFTVVCGDEKCDLGAGFYLMASAGDFVWSDDNANGIQESWEPRLAGVTIQAIDITGDIIEEALTDNAGNYQINNLQKEDYYFKVILPSGLMPTIANMGGDNNDSDVDHSNGANTTKLYSMLPGENISSIDVGLVADNLVPVVYKAFGGMNYSDYNSIYWKTEAEFNNDRFELERRFENGKFEKITNVKGAGTYSGESTYYVEDYDIANEGTYNYRLKQIGYDGAINYSGNYTIKVYQGSISIYPNPTIDQLNVKLQSSFISDSGVKIQIFDSSSTLVETRTLSSEFVKLNSLIQLDVSGLTEGIYTVKVVNGDEEFEQKVIKIE